MGWFTAGLFFCFTPIYLLSGCWSREYFLRLKAGGVNNIFLGGFTLINLFSGCWSWVSNVFRKTGRIVIYICFWFMGKRLEEEATIFYLLCISWNIFHIFNCLIAIYSEGTFEVSRRRKIQSNLYWSVKVSVHANARLHLYCSMYIIYYIILQIRQVPS